MEKLPAISNLTIENLPASINEKLSTDFPRKEGFIRAGADNLIMPKAYVDFAEVIRDFEARPDDIYISTIPRSGTTVTQELIWLIANDLDYETASNVTLHKRFPFMEAHVYFTDKDREEFKFIEENRDIKREKPVDCLVERRFSPIYEYLSSLTTRRFIKSHLPLNYMPSNIANVGAKVVYVARNPKDVAVSTYHFFKSKVIDFRGSFEDFADYFMNDLMVGCSPYWKQVLGGWSRRNDKNFHFMFYEDILLNPEDSIKKLAKFLNKSLNDDELAKLKNYIQFDNFKKKNSIRPSLIFSNSLRRGKIGGNPEMTVELSEKFDEWTKKNLKNSDLKFPVDF